ncbi:MAG: hypothetical protein JNL43_02145 [Flavobacteriales bacterium]|nr:hypothetical protein [Flavobacteriales bacterium]
MHPNRALGKFLTVLALLAQTNIATCQDQPSRQYRVHVQHMQGGLSPKSMFGVLQQWIDATEFDHDKDTRTLLFTTPETIHLEELRQRLAPTGYQVLGYTATRLNGEAEDLEEGMPPYPIFQDTGNELEDHARYHARKSAWIAAWPQEYERRTTPWTKEHGE